MRILGLTISKDPKPVPLPPSRFCTCDSLLHLTRVASLARDVLIAYFLFRQVSGG